jgi:hypothetical protein
MPKLQQPRVTSSIRFQSSICALLLIAALSGSAHAQWASDSTFNNADWTAIVLPYPLSDPNAKCGTLAIPCGQDPNGNPSPSRKTYHNYDGTNGNPKAIWVAHLYQPLSSIYDPSTQGAIAGVSYSYDLIQHTGGGQAVTHALLAYQNNTYYFSYRSNSNPSTDLVYNSPNWQSFPLPSATPKILTAADFQKVSNTGSTEHPDFSCKGKPIQFGYVTGNSNTNPTISAVDNWRVDIIKGDPCCGAIKKPEVRCNKGGGFTYNFEVTNTSTKPTQYILLSPPPGATYTISPSSINTPLNPGQSTPVSVNITNASPNASICIDVLLADKGAKPCCKLQTCLPAPECPCLKRLKETVECGPVGGSYTYTVQLQNLTGSPIQQIFVIPTSPAGITVTPSMVPVILPAYGQASFQVTITNVAPGSTVVLQLAPSGAEPLCCSMQIRFTVPKQGQC